MSEAMVLGEDQQKPNADTVPFIHVQEHVQKVYADNLAKYSGPLFATKTDGLSSIYVQGFPEEIQQHFNCACCRDFIREFGGAVFITPEGKTVSAYWSAEDAPEGFGDIFAAMKKFVEEKRVASQFFGWDTPVWGSPEAGGWNHFAVPSLDVCVAKHPFGSPAGARGNSRERFKSLMLMLDDFALTDLYSAIDALETKQLNSSEQFLPMVKFAIDMKKVRETVNYQNKLRLAAATAPAGWCEMRSKVVGNLVDWCKEGLAFEVIKRRFNAMTRKEVYQRPVAAPSEGNILQAEKLIETLGLADSLPRRAASLSEILPHAAWVPEEAQPSNPVQPAGVFGHLKTKEKDSATESPTLSVPPREITLSLFWKEILPNAAQIKVLIQPTDSYVFTGTTTAENPDAKPILKWDNEEHRNPFAHFSLNQSALAFQVGAPTNWATVTGVFENSAKWNGGHSHGGFEYLNMTLAGFDKDVFNNVSNALFPEIVRGELHGVRATLESYNKNRLLGNMEDVSARGVLVRVGMIFSITPKGGDRAVTYKIGFNDL